MHIMILSYTYTFFYLYILVGRPVGRPRLVKTEDQKKPAVVEPTVDVQTPLMEPLSSLAEDASSKKFIDSTPDTKEVPALKVKRRASGKTPAAENVHKISQKSNQSSVIRDLSVFPETEPETADSKIGKI